MAYKDLCDKGGKAKFVIYPNGISPVETVLTESLTQDIIMVLVSSYNDKLKEIHKEINNSFHEKMEVTK